MGSGKSHWGRIWAEHYGLEYADLDTLIEKSSGLTIRQFFEKKGEKAFREAEREQLQKFAGREGVLVSCGGGTPCFLDNLEWMKGHGTVVYLKATPAYLLSRVKDEIDKRPVLKKTNESELLFFIEKTLDERSKFYEQADVILLTETLHVKSLDAII